MKKTEAIRLAYQIATLNEIPDDLLGELTQLDYLRVLEVLLVLRQSPNRIKAPANFIRSAIRNNWKPGGTPEKRISEKKSEKPIAPDRYDSFYRMIEG
ncbi:hypothetical protein P4V33_09410 [Brevibacillus borstelensis]|uniref:hypothetical protein n=1 Tax=Brevibacillus borstelensis TaxID=45462 RepID=UPI002E239B71|nr:hypothetical protein [Brevibacillus borstelensis]